LEKENRLLLQKFFLSKRKDESLREPTQ
jgi:hypothetical protein